MELDNNTSTPLYLQLEGILLDQIKSGALAPGDRLPTEQELSKQYNVSRVTVRKALESLSKNCYLERKSGKGTFIAEKKLQRSISGISSFSEMCRMQGMKPGAKTLKLTLEDPTDLEREKMQLSPTDKIVVLERIRYADGIPVTIELTKLPEDFFFLFDEDLTNASLYEVLKRHDIVFTRSIKALEIVFANYQQSKYLNIPKGHPLLSITSTVADVNGSYLHLSQQLSVADRFKLFV